MNRLIVAIGLLAVMTVSVSAFVVTHARPSDSGDELGGGKTFIGGEDEGFKISVTDPDDDTQWIMHELQATSDPSDGSWKVALNGAGSGVIVLADGADSNGKA
ncbi:MAG: hypothetical protein V1787_00560 [Candidatus Micrarchaeota archaeon]